MLLGYWEGWDGKCLPLFCLTTGLYRRHFGKTSPGPAIQPHGARAIIPL